MKRLFKLLLFLLLLFPITAFAKQQVISCGYFFFNYKDTNSQVGSGSGAQGQFTIFDDDSIEWKVGASKVVGNSINIYEKDYNSNILGDIITVNFSSIPNNVLLNITKNQNNTYNCPTLYSVVEASSSINVSFSEAYGGDEFTDTGNWIYVAINNEETIYDNKNENKVIHSCDLKIDGNSNTIGIDDTIFVSFRKFDNNDKKICIGNTKDSALSNCKISNDYNTTFGILQYQFVVDQKVWNSIFQDEKCSLNDIGFEYNPDSVDNKSNYTIKMKSDIKTPDDSQGGFKEPSANDNNDDFVADNCNTVPKAIIEYINDALKLLRWAALALMIILGVLDFTKAVASDDQDALKKAWQHFTKRLIAVIILFLIPLLIELILTIADLNNNCSNF